MRWLGSARHIRLRRRYRELLRAEIANTVSSQEEVGDEMLDQRVQERTAE